VSCLILSPHNLPINQAVGNPAAVGVRGSISGRIGGVSAALAGLDCHSVRSRLLRSRPFF
jgi:hypothetical protein